MSSETDPALNDVDFSDSTDVVAQHASVHREKRIDPQTGTEPVSLWFLLICAVVLVIGAGYLGATSAGFDMNAYNIHGGGGGAGYTPDSPTDQPMDGGPPPINGKKIFARCAACHGPGGQGKPGTIPPLAGSRFVTDDPVRLSMLVLNGLSGPIEVKGNIYTGVMSAQKTSMSDAEISAVLSYIRSDWGNASPPISEDFIAQVREKTASQALPYKLAELEEKAKALAPEIVAEGGGEEAAGGGGDSADTGTPPAN